MEIVTESIKALVKDDGFVCLAFEIATSLLKWIASTNSKSFSENVKGKVDKRRLWTHYHSVKTSRTHRTCFCSNPLEYHSILHKKCTINYLEVAQARAVPIIKELTTIELDALKDMLPVM